MISKTQINKRIKQKTNSDLVQTIIKAKKINPELAACLAVPSRDYTVINVKDLNKAKSEIVLVPGKVLSNGEIEKNKKMKVYALGFSKGASEKLKKAGCEFLTILKAMESLKKGDKLKGEIVR